MLRTPMVDEFSDVPEPSAERTEALKPEGLGVVAVALFAVVVAIGLALGEGSRRRFVEELASIAADWERQAPAGVLATAARRLIRPALAVLDR